MKNSKFGVLFFGMGLTHSRGKPYNVANAISLVRDLNAHTKFAVIPMRGHYNVLGFNQVCTWSTGFAFAVDFARGQPWYNPGETSTVDVLNRGECDSALIVASDPAAHFPRKSVEHLARIPLIQIDPYASLTTELADVVLPAAIAGIEVEGTAYRMDGVPLRLRKLIEPVHLSDEEILSRILSKVREIRGD
jgi:formylmethanofuran dehydrogenase subunit B